MSRSNLERKPLSESVSAGAGASVGGSAAPQRTSNAADALGVREQIDLLKTAFPPENKREVRNTWAETSVALRRLFKTAVALALVIALGWMPLQRLYTTTSAEATVNARIMWDPLESTCRHASLSIL